MSRRFKRGDQVVLGSVRGTVLRVAADGTWADVGWHNADGSYGWTKRQPDASRLRRWQPEPIDPATARQPLINRINLGGGSGGSGIKAVGSAVTTIEEHARIRAAAAATGVSVGAIGRRLLLRWCEVIERETAEREIQRMRRAG